MKLTATITLGLLAFVIIAAGAIAVWGLSTHNRAASLRNLYESKEKANTASFDNMWKKIAQVTQVTDIQKEALMGIFVGYAQARNGGGGSGSFINAVREAIPTVDSATFTNLQNIITGSRDEWTANQIALVDISREYNLMLVQFPSSLLLSILNFKKIDPKVITSSRTENAFQAGKDDEVNLKK